MSASLLSEPAAPTFDEPLAMLSACHGRIERQLETLARLQLHLPEHGHDADARAAARAILRYFDTAAPNHHADEEKSIFPRLIDARVPGVEALIADLERDHAVLAANWRRLRPLLSGIVAGAHANLSPQQVRAVTAAYRTHIAREERDLIPLAAATFDATTIEAIGREMAQRRSTDAAAANAPRGSAVRRDPGTRG